MRMKWNSSTVPVVVEERHNLSLCLGKAFAMSYAIHPLSEQTCILLDIYRSSRRMVDSQTNRTGRYGASDAHDATQGGSINV